MSIMRTCLFVLALVQLASCLPGAPGFLEFELRRSNNFLAFHSSLGRAINDERER